MKRKLTSSIVAAVVAAYIAVLALNTSSYTIRYANGDTRTTYVVGCISIEPGSEYPVMNECADGVDR